MKDLTKELQERNREKGRIALINKENEQTKPMYCYSTDDLDTLTAQTIQATLERVIEDEEKMLELLTEEDAWGRHAKQDTINRLKAQLNNI